MGLGIYEIISGNRTRDPKQMVPAKIEDSFEVAPQFRLS
jgi:hypothetical protein